jgi:SAM-dependent methyltransferase
MVPFRYLLEEARRSKSIARILTNWVLRQYRTEVRGWVLDLGCGDAPSYWRLMEIQQNSQVKHLVAVDYSISCRPSLVAELDHPLPFKDRCADVVIIGGVLMLLPNPQALLNETHRLLNRDGKILLYTSLIWHHNPDPHDYWRFTEEALRLLLERAGFADIEIVPIGGRWSAAAYLLSPFLRPRWLVATIVYWTCLQLDAWTEKRFRLPKCPVGYIGKAKASV